MNRQTFAWGRELNKQRPRDNWIEILYIVGLLVAALVLFSINLGGLPLRDWDEGTVAQVAKEISLASHNSEAWLFPTLWSKPYLDRAPLVHWLIAFVYSFAGVNEWTTRLPSALLSAFSVPLLYGIGREIFAVRKAAFYSALIFLTLLPVVRQGRLAMLDSAVVCFSLLMIWSVLRSRRDLRYCILAGIGFGLICLTRGIMGLLMGAIALLFMIWDTPRLLNSIYLWVGLLLGSAPVIAWYTLQWLHYGTGFTNTISVQFFQGPIDDVDDRSSPAWYYLLELLKYSWPWLIFCLYGLKQALDNRNWGWAKLILVWSGVYFIAVSLVATKLPWYIMPIYPALALAGGAQLARIRNLPKLVSYPRSWTIVLGLLAIVSFVACSYFGFSENRDLSLILICASVGLTLALAALLVGKRDRQFIWVLFWGIYVSLLLFFSSSHWIWELNKAYPVKPVAAIINRGIPASGVVYTSFKDARPSLNFYSDRQVIPETTSELAKLWQQSTNSYFLLDKVSFDELNFSGVRQVGTAPPNWVLITKDNN